MNRIVKSRTIRIPCSAVNPAVEDLALAIPTVPERGAAKRSSPALPARTERSECAPCTTAKEGFSRPGPALAAVEGSGAEGSEPRRLRSGRICGVERARPPHPGRHARLCTICCHPDRDAIEEDFIHWHSPSDMAIDYHLPDRSSVYRHAHAAGLFARRSRNLRFVLERLLERVDKVKVTAHAVVRAVRAYTRINERGEWVEPPTRIIVSSDSLPAAPALPDGTKRHKRVPGKATGRSVLIATGGHSRDEPTH